MKKEKEGGGGGGGEVVCMKEPTCHSKFSKQALYAAPQVPIPKYGPRGLE